MISQKRYQEILELLAIYKTVTLGELVDKLKASESTIRRDLVALDKMGKLRKIHGGATLVEDYLAEEMHLATKYTLAKKEKESIAKYAASLIQPRDLVYLDAGSTTELMVPYLKEKDALYVTNGLTQAQKLINAGFRCLILGGELKEITGAIIGSMAILSLKNYNFTKGFFGSNGVSINAGFTTPDIAESSVKQEAFSRCQEKYILADSSKFDRTAAITFAELSQGKIITERLINDNYKKYTEIVETYGDEELADF